jgi:hypothetical protein
VSTFLGVTYGITGQLGLSVKSNYSWLDLIRERPAVISNGVVLLPGATIEQGNNDIGDGTVGVQYAILPMNWPRQYELLAGFDITIPWGEDAKFENNIQLPDNIQTGSGGYAASLFVGYTKSFPSRHLAFSSVVAHRVKFKTRRDKEPGDESSLFVSTSIGPLKSLSFHVPFGYKTVQATYSKFGIKEVSTVGSRIDFMPGIEWSLTHSLKMSAQTDIPVWRDKYQKLYGNNFGVRFSTSVLID